ncbi:MAG TPA: carboxypeptidase regulatory-like domain-containing protein [Terriglobia bacterium]|nr:carboxypeptidase regulatory-like domain-containing protein [Terriglobia bacterium]
MKTRQFAHWVLLTVLGLALGLCVLPVQRVAARGQNSQMENLEGQVSNDHNVPLENAVCTLTASLLPPGGLTVDTDRLGKFRFPQLSPSVYTLTCAAMGYRPIEKQVDLTQASPYLEVVLSTEEVLRQSIEVRAKAPTAGLEQGAPPATISSRQITDLPLTEQKFKAALPLIPGVIRTPDGKINIKGVPENQGLLLLDGAENVDPVTGSFSVDVPIQAIESLQVYKNAYRADYGGFSGGLTTINTKPPGSQWHYEVEDITPNPRFRSGHLVGMADFNPRFYVTGPIISNRLNFSEALAYDDDKQPVRGLAWPNNEIKSHDFTSLTTFQYVFSARHVATVQANFFPLTREFANINSLVPQTASSNYGQSGFSIALTDRYLTSSGRVFTTIAEGMRFDSYGHGQGPLDMLVTPTGWDGNFFNTFDRTSNEEQIRETVTLPSSSWHGNHDFTVGGGFIQRAFSGTSDSRPVQILRTDGTLAEQIGFRGPGQLSASDSEGAAFVQDHWAMAKPLALDLGLRFTGQTLGTPLNFAPRLGVVYSPGAEGKTVLRAGMGVFYSHVPLLVGGFTGNPVREVSVFDAQGLPVGVPVAFPNYYGNLENPQDPHLSLSPPDRTPFNLTYSLEVDRELRPNVTLRVSALSSHSQHEFIVDPLTGLPSGAALVASPTGASSYREFQTTLHVRINSNSEWSFAYVNSEARGNLNSLVQLYVPFEAPVIRPDAYANLPSDIPNRLITWGRMQTHVWGIEASPVIDWHSGFPYSFVDEYQNYAGTPNGQRFPQFFSLDLKLGKEFTLPFPWVKNHRLRGALTIFNLTNHSNPRDVYNNVTSPYFQHFVGFQHRFFDSELDIVY